MALTSVPGGPVYNATVSGTISATTAGVNGPDVDCAMVEYSLNGDETNYVRCSDSAGTGGKILLAGSNGKDPCKNISMDKFWASTGTITVNYKAWK